MLRSFRWGHARQLDRVSRELLARAWAAGAGPRSLNNHGPLTIDLDPTICETYGPAKEGARHHGYTGGYTEATATPAHQRGYTGHHGYTGQRGYHPLLAVAAGTGDVLMARLREGRANTARGAAHFLRETMGRVRYAGATGLLTVRADSGFYHHAMVTTCRQLDARFSITIRQHQSRRNQIEAIPEGDWTPLPYWMDGAADVAETTYIPFESAPDARTGAAHRPQSAAHARFSTGPLGRLQLSRLHHRPGRRHSGTGGTLELEALWNWRPIIAATPRSRTPSATSSTAWD